MIEKAVFKAEFKKTYFNVLFEVHKEYIVNLGYSIVKKYSYLQIPLERNDFYSIAWQICRYLVENRKKLKEKNYSLRMVVKCQTIQKTIHLIRKYQKNTEIILSKAESYDAYGFEKKIDELTLDQEYQIKYDHQIYLKCANKCLCKFGHCYQNVFKLYLLGHTNKKIASKTSLDPKKIANMIYQIKKSLKKVVLR